MRLQQLTDMLFAGGAGAATSLFHRMKSGNKITLKVVLIDAALAACSMVAAYIACEIFSLTPDLSRAVYFFAGWLGSRVISIVDRRSDAIIERMVDKATEKVIGNE